MKVAISAVEVPVLKGPVTDPTRAVMEPAVKSPLTVPFTIFTAVPVICAKLPTAPLTLPVFSKPLTEPVWATTAPPINPSPDKVSIVPTMELNVIACVTVVPVTVNPVT